MNFLTRPARFLFFFALALPLTAQEDAPSEEPPLFRAQSIDAGIGIGHDLAIADVDGDGRPDLLVANEREIVCYRAPEWHKFVMARELPAGEPVCLAARDLDGDGKCEVAVGISGAPEKPGSGNVSGSVLYLLPGKDRTKPWTAVSLPGNVPVRRMQWARTEANRWSLLVQPLVSPDREGEGGSFVTYPFPSDPARPEQWQPKVLDDSLHGPSGFDVHSSPAGPETMVLAGKEGLLVSKLGAPFRPELDIASFEDHPGLGQVRFGPKFSPRGRSLVFYTAIERAPGNELVVYRAINGADGAAGWERTVVDDSLREARAVACADLLGLGREQIVAGWRSPNDQGKTGIKLYVWEFGEWLTTPVDSGAMACEDLEVGDLNQDGKLDVAALGRSSKNVVIYWNEASLQSPPEPESTWQKHVLWQGEDCPSAVAADFTGDGAVDVGFSSGGRAHLLTAPDWKHRFLSAEGVKSGGVHCAALDADADGDLDFITSPRELSWLENPGKAAASSQPWTSRVIDRDPDGIHCVLPADINGDGKLDLLANQFNPVGPLADSLMWYETPANRDGPWPRHVLASGDAPGGSHYLGFGDLNGDRLPDLVAAAKGDPFEDGHWFAWWKNPGLAAIKQPWERSWVATEQWQATNILPGDVDKDGDLDLLASRGHGVGVICFRNVKGDASEWELVEIDPLIAQPHSLAAADLDGDGDLDAATCGYGDRIVAWYENDGTGEFLIHDLDHDQEGYDLRILDMDGDGDLDLLLAGRNSGNVVFYANPLQAKH